jgi:hypothetical protein
MRTILRRWPTLLALGLTVLTWDGPGGERGLAEALLLLPLLYLVVAGLERPRASWPILVVGIGVFVALRATDVVAPTWIFGGIAAAALLWGVVSGALWRSSLFQLQAVGMVAFGGLAVAGLYAEPDVARVLVGVGWLLHGLWDLYHLRARAVVAPTYAEWCGVIDVAIGAQLLLLG